MGGCCLRAKACSLVRLDSNKIWNMTTGEKTNLQEPELTTGEMIDVLVLCPLCFLTSVFFSKSTPPAYKVAVERHGQLAGIYMCVLLASTGRQGR